MPVPPTSRYFQVASNARGRAVEMQQRHRGERDRLGRNPEQPQMPRLMPGA